MFNKSTSSTNSKDNQSPKIATSRNSQKIVFTGSIKRQKGIFTRWKDRNFKILHAPNHVIMMSISHIDSKKIEEIINLSYSRITSKCSKTDDYTFFGLIVPSGNKYLISAMKQQETRSIHLAISKIRRDAKKFIEGSSEQSSNSKIIKDYQQEQYYRQFQSNQKGNKNLEFQKASEESESLAQPSQVYTTVLKMEEENYQEPVNSPPQISPLVLQKPLSKVQIEHLQSDQGFKLHCNLNEGRLLTKNQSFIKANMLLNTHYSHKDLLQSFFHLQLWNQRIKEYKIVNRIDKGIYTCYIQLKPQGFFSLPKYAYVMLTTWSIGDSVLMIMKSLDFNSFQKQQGCSPINFNLFVRVKENVGSEKLMTVLLQLNSVQSYEQGLNFIKQLRTYQSFLKTTFKLPHKILQWRQGGELNYIC